MASPNSKRIKFTADNVDHYEREFRLEHDRAMGYIPRVTSPVQDIVALAMQVFQPPPSIQPIMETFRTWINSDRLATFDCFQEPSWECPCYKCTTWRTKRESETDFMEGVMDEYVREAILGDVTPTGNDEEIPENETAKCDKHSLFTVRFACVSHFYTDLPNVDTETPSTPKFSVVEYDLPDSDHGKQKAQQKWIALMQITPTRLVF